MAAVRVMRGVADMFVPGQEVFHPSLLGSQAACAAEVASLAGAGRLLRSAGWEVAASPRLATAHALAFLAARSATAKAADVITALAQLATSLAAVHGAKAAEPVLALADRRFPATEHKGLAFARLVIAHGKAVRRMELQHADNFGRRLVGLAAPDDATDIGLRLDAEETLVRTLWAGSQFSRAEKDARRLFHLAYKTGQQRHALRLLLLIARCHIDGGTPETALPYVVSCMQQCKEVEADAILLEATVYMTEVWYRIGPFHAARAILEVEDVLPLVLAHGSLELRSRAQRILAEASMATHATTTSLAGQAPRIEALLRDAAAGFTALEDWRLTADVMGLQAALFHGLGRISERDAAARRANKLRRERCIEAIL